MSQSLKANFGRGENVNTNEANKKKPRRYNAPTVNEILSDELTNVASEYWAISPGASQKPYSAEIIETIYKKELASPHSHRIMLLELSRYLEKYLIPNFDHANSSVSHVLSIIVMVNEKFREGVEVWDSFKERGPDFFKNFFGRVLSLRTDKVLDGQERISYIVFLTNCFMSLEERIIRLQVLKLVSFHIWLGLTPGRLRQELRSIDSDLRLKIEAVQEKYKEIELRNKANNSANPTPQYERTFIPTLIDEFLDMISNIGSKGQNIPRVLVRYSERFVELLTDLLAQLATRRFLRVYLEDKHVIVKCRMSALSKLPQGRLFNQLVERMFFYQGFEIDDFTGDSLTVDDMTLRHSERIKNLQRVAFKDFQPELKELALSNIASIETREKLTRYLDDLSDEKLHTLCARLNLLPLPEEDPDFHPSREFMVEVIVLLHEKRPSQLDAINQMSLYPAEDTLWDFNTVPSGVHYSGENIFALPKLNLQFLTLHDYLLRNFDLFRLESMYEIRSDVEDSVSRVNPRTDPYTNSTIFSGWSRMSLPIRGGVRITHVSLPLLGDIVPHQVTAEFSFTLANVKGQIRSEWELIRQHDILFLITVRGPSEEKRDEEMDDGVVNNEADEADKTFPERFGVVAVRGCEVIEIVDEDGTIVKDIEVELEGKFRAGNKRTVKVFLDPAQYYIDTAKFGVKENNLANIATSITKKDAGVIKSGAKNTNGKPENQKSNVKIGGGSESIEKAEKREPEVISLAAPELYSTLNLVLRRKPKENNFKAVLSTIRELMNTRTAVPDWLHDIFLGYGNPSNRDNSFEGTMEIDFGDTFLDKDHLWSSFPGRELEVKEHMETKDGGSVDIGNLGPQHSSTLAPPFKIIFPEDSNEKEPLLVESYIMPNPGPYPQDKPKKNQIPFTPVQIEAIRSGVNKGLTMVIGPPGSGKTDLAVQIISILYHTFPQQRTLLVTHSNQALNQLFEKIMALDIDERHLLRLGHGQTELETEKDFSKIGRVNYMLGLRLKNLEEVERLAKTLKLSTESDYTCETAAHFYLFHIVARWEEFLVKCSKANSEYPASFIFENFPFTEFFSTAPQPLFAGNKFDEDLETARGCFRHLQKMFTELEECRAFELLRNSHDRANYLLTKQAKIIAMTCTHAALKRGDLVELGFKYDNLLMEEAAQILEIETFIPMLLQNTDEKEGSRLKRCVLIGDHHQLPPVIQNMAFQKYSHLDQSLFARFVRLGVPTIQLNQQGRARPSIAELYSWRYKKLGNLPIVLQRQEYLSANAGFAYDYQLIDVQDYEGQGETEPNPYFYQNLGEAEYVVLVYMFMRLLGYPAEKISIITTYNGQKALIRDVIEQRCARDPAFGKPHKITTVDKFQGQQNDYILLSLVRTKTVGHLRDVRRLVVAMSRARLGLYVFGRRALFENCYELTPVFSKLRIRPDKLILVQNEVYSTTLPRLVGEVISPPLQPIEVQDLTHMSNLIYQPNSPIVVNYNNRINTNNNNNNNSNNNNNNNNNPNNSSVSSSDGNDTNKTNNTNIETETETTQPQTSSTDPMNTSEDTSTSTTPKE